MDFASWTEQNKKSSGRSQTDEDKKKKEEEEKKKKQQQNTDDYGAVKPLYDVVNSPVFTYNSNTKTSNPTTNNSFNSWTAANRAQSSAGTWAKESTRLLNDIGSYYSQWGTKEEQDAKAKTFTEQLNEFINASKRYENSFQEKGAFRSLTNAMKEAPSYMKDATDMYSQFNSQKDYDSAVRIAGYQKKYEGYSYTQKKNAIEQMKKNNPSATAEERKWLEYTLHDNMTVKDYDDYIKEKEQELAEYKKTWTGKSKAALADPEGAANTWLEKKNEIENEISKAKSRRYMLQKGAEYESVKKNADYVRYAKLNPSQDIRNIVSTGGHLVQGEYVEDVKPEGDWKPEDWTQDEVDTATYIYNTQGEQAAKDYWNDYLKYVVLERAANRKQQEYSEYATKNFGTGILSSALSVGGTLMSGTGLTSVFGQNLRNKLSGEEGYRPINYYGDAFDATRYSSAVRGAISENLDSRGVIQLDEDQHPVLSKLLNGKGLGFLYQTGMSMADSAALAGITMGLAPALGGAAKFTTVLLGGSAGSQGILDALERGASDEQALLMGVFNATFETLFEEVSLDHLIHPDKNFIVNLFKQGFVEGSEEVATSFFNNLADVAIMASNSEYMQKAQEYMDQGYSEEEAIRKALQSTAVDIMWDYLGGAISGGIMGAMSTGRVNIMRNASYANLARGMEAQDIISDLQAVDPSNKLAAKMQTKLTNDGDLGTWNKARMLNQTAQAIMQNDVDSIRTAVVERLTELGETRDIEKVADAIVDIATADQLGEEASKRSALRIQDSIYGNRVLNELNGNNIESGDYSSNWTKNIRTEMLGKSNRDVYMFQRAVKNFISNNEDTLAEEGFTVVRDEEGNVQRVELATEDEPEEQVDIKEVSQKYGAQAQTMIDAYEEGQNVADYDVAFKDVYDMARSGVSLAAAQKAMENSVLSKEQVKTAYEAGRATSGAAATERQNIISEKQSNNNDQKKGKRRHGTVRGDNVTVSDIESVLSSLAEKSGEKTREFARKAIAVMSAVADITGVDIVLYSSAADENGNYKDANGRYEWKDSKIYIDINAGLSNISEQADISKRTLLQTFTHEFVHFIEQWSPVEYNELREVVMSEIEKTEDPDALIRDKMERLNIDDYEMASREVVADGLSWMLPQSQFVENLAKNHQNIFKKLMEKLNEFFNYIVSVFSESGNQRAREASAVMQDIDGAIRYGQELVNLFDRVAQSAVENYQATQETTKAPKKNSSTKKAAQKSNESKEQTAESENEDTPKYKEPTLEGSLKELERLKGQLSPESYQELIDSITYNDGVLSPDDMVVVLEEHLANAQESGDTEAAKVIQEEIEYIQSNVWSFDEETGRWNKLDPNAVQYNDRQTERSLIEYSMNRATVNYAVKYTADKEAAKRLKTFLEILDELRAVETEIKNEESRVMTEEYRKAEHEKERELEARGEKRKKKWSKKLKRYLEIDEETKTKTSHSLHEINKTLADQEDHSWHQRLLDIQKKANDAGITCDFVTEIGDAYYLENEEDYKNDTDVGRFKVMPGLKGLPIEYVEAGEKSSKFVERTSPEARSEGYKFSAFKRTIPQRFLDSIPVHVRERLRGELVKAVEDAYKKGRGSKILSAEEMGKAFPTLKELTSVAGAVEDVEKIAGKTMAGVQAPLRNAQKTVAALNLNSACPMFTIGNHGCYLDACYLTQMANGANGTNLFESAMYCGEILQMSDKVVELINKMGGMRVNGVGDTIADNTYQLLDVIKHASMRGLKLKWITKQRITFDILLKAKAAGIKMTDSKGKGLITVQPSMDNIWVPAALDNIYAAGVRGTTQLAATVKKGEDLWNVDREKAEAILNNAAAAYEADFGRYAKIIDGKLYRKYGFAPEQVNEMIRTAREQLPGVTVTPRYVVCTPAEIAEIALNRHGLIVNGGAIIQTLMHGAVPPECVSDYGTELVNFGDLRHVVEKLPNGEWDFYGVHVKEVLDEKGNPVIEKGKVKTEWERVYGENSPYEKVKAYVNGELKDGTPRFTEHEKQIIWQTLRESMCCQANESKDACAGCASLCANGALIAGVQARQAENLQQVKPGNPLPSWVQSEGTQNVEYSLRPVEPIEPSDGASWKRTRTTEEAIQMAAARGIEMWNVSAEESEENNPTQMKDAKGGTTNTYRKLFNDLKAEGFTGRILDASSGAGYGTALGREGQYGFDITDIEPFPGNDRVTAPNYTDYTQLAKDVESGKVKKFDYIISNAVLNVLPQDQRDALVVQMGELLAPGGRMFINVRGTSEIENLAKNPKNVRLGPHEAVESNHGSYQYGFSMSELKSYLRDALGDGYKIETAKVGGTSVIVTKENNVEYSKRDSEGNTLTVGQQEFFKESKARDKNGNLLRLYSGTATGGFTIFRDGKIWLTTVYDSARAYGGAEKGNIFAPSRSAEITSDSPIAVKKRVEVATTSDERDSFFFDSQEDLDEFEKKVGGKVSDYMDQWELSDYEYEADDAEYEERERLSKAIEREYAKYNRAHLRQTTIAELLKNPDAYLRGDFVRAIYAIDSNAAPDEDGLTSKQDLIDALFSYYEEDHDKPRDEYFDIPVLARVPEGTTSSSKSYNDTHTVYAMYANTTHPYIVDNGHKRLNAKGSIYYQSIDYAYENSDKYDGVIINDVEVGPAGSGYGTAVVVFNSNQIKSVNNHNPTDNKDIRYQKRETDAKYMAAVNSGDMKTAQKMVDEAAADAGWRPRHTYHGTRAYGFTVFDKSKADVEGNSGAGFYFSTSTGDSRNNYESESGPDVRLKLERLADAILSNGEWNGVSIEDYDQAKQIARKLIGTNPGVYDVYLKYDRPYVRNYSDSTNLYNDFVEGYDREEYEDIYDYLADKVGRVVRSAIRKFKDNYEVVNYLGSSYITSEIVTNLLDDNSLTWADIEEIVNSDNGTEVAGEFETKWAYSELTRQIIEELGYDAVVDKEVAKKFWRMFGPEDAGTEHIIVFNPNQIKSSDPVTYDDNGNVIPLSQRFNPNEQDIRYSARELDEKYMAAVESGDMETAQKMVDEKAIAAGAMTLLNGKRKPYYHGSSAHFTIFDINKAKEGNYGYGFYFSPMKSKAGDYGDVRSFYLMTNRIATRDNNSITTEQVQKIFDEYNIPFDDTIGRYVDSVDEWVNRHNDKDIVLELERFIHMYTAVEPADFLQRFRQVFGYDGVRQTNETVLWDNRLAKSADPVTYDDNGNVIPLSERFNTNETDIRKQQRTEAITDRELLQMSAEDLLASDTLTEGERSALQIITKRLDKLQELKDQRTELGRLYKQQQFEEGGDRQAAKQTLERMHILDKKVADAENAVLSVKDKEVLKNVLKRSRKNLESIDREKAREMVRRYRDRRDNAEAVRKYRKRIQKDTSEIASWITKPSSKDAMKNVPTAIRKPIIEILTSIDKTSKRALAGKAPTKADAEYIKQLRLLQTELGNTKNADALYSGYEDLPSDFMDTVNTIVQNAEEIAEKFKGHYILNQMDSEELKTMSEFVRILKKFIHNASQQLTFAGKISDLGDESIEDMKQMKPLKTKGGERFFMYQTMRPIDVFDRFGRGGKKIFKSLTHGQAQMAFDTKEIIEKAESLYTTKEVKEWTKKTIEVTLGGEKVKMPISYAMGLYELSKRKNAEGHLYGNGVRVATFKDGRNKIADEGHKVTREEIKALESKLTKRQKEVADSLQQYMADQGAKWGNAISLARFGIEQFTEQDYYPIASDGRFLPASADEKPSIASLYALLNMSFTKDLKENANNRAVIYDIFDVFSNHMSAMAQYHSFALPVLDALKWLNYEQFEEVPDTYKDGRPKLNEDGTPKMKKGDITGSVREQMARVFGNDEEKGRGGVGYANTFVTNILKAINGTEAQGDTFDTAAMKLLRAYNVSRIAYNVRVVMQQPMAITRAGMVMSYASISKALARPDLIPKNIKEMESKNGIAAWKGLGFYDVNVTRSMTDLIRHNETVMDKVNEVGLKGAETADRVTWAIMWQAAKNEAQSKRHVSPTDSNYWDTVNDIFDETIYRTQVVDSVLTKNEYLRSKGFFARTSGSFMSEPMTTYSMLASAYDKFRMDMARGMSKSQAWKNNGRNIARTAAVYSISAILLAAVQGVADAWRDDDKYETFDEKYFEAFKGNVVDELVPFNNLPIFSDVWNIMKQIASILGVDTYGNDPRQLYLEFTKDLIPGIQRMYDLINNPDDTNYTWYGAIYKLLSAASGLTGVPFSTVTREVVDAWNNTVGHYAPSLVIKDYDAGYKNEIKYAFMDGYLTQEEAISELMQRGEDMDEDTAFWLVNGWSTGITSKYGRLDNSLLENPSDVKDAITELTSHGVKLKSVNSHIKSKIGEWFRGDGETTITRSEAKQLLLKNLDMEDKDAEELLDKWSMKNETGIAYDDMKEAYLDGDITYDDAIYYRTQYGNVERDTAKKTVDDWKIEKQYGFSYSDIDDAFLAGKMTSTQLKNAYITHGYDDEKADQMVELLEFKKKYPKAKDFNYSTMSAYKEYCEADGVPVDTFYDVWKFKNNTSADVDANGKSINGSKREKVLEYIDSMNISSMDKDSLYFACGYALSTLKNAPWH